jgi:hypothetical protein
VEVRGLSTESRGQRSEGRWLGFVVSHPSAIKLRKDGAPNLFGYFKGGAPGALMGGGGAVSP